MRGYWGTGWLFRDGGSSGWVSEVDVGRVNMVGGFHGVGDLGYGMGQRLGFDGDR